MLGQEGRAYKTNKQMVELNHGTGPFVSSEAYTIAGISSGGLAGSRNFHNVASPETIVSGNRVCQLYSGELCLLQSTASIELDDAIQHAKRMFNVLLLK